MPWWLSPADARDVRASLGLERPRAQEYVFVADDRPAVSPLPPLLPPGCHVLCVDCGGRPYRSRCVGCPRLPDPLRSTNEF